MKLITQLSSFVRQLTLYKVMVPSLAMFFTVVVLLFKGMVLCKYIKLQILNYIGKDVKFLQLKMLYF